MDTAQPLKPWPLAGGLSTLAVATLVGGGLYLVERMKPERVAAPTAYSSFAAKDGSFRCVYPKGWRADNFEAQGTVSVANFSRGGARITLDCDLTGSLVAGTGAGLGAGLNTDELLAQVQGMGGGSAGLANARQELKKPPVERLHESSLKECRERLELARLTKYAEGKARRFEGRFGEGRLSEFSAQGPPFTGKVRGYRVTILGSERALTGLCWAPKSDWAALEKPFQKVIGSVAPGGG